MPPTLQEDGLGGPPRSSLPSTRGGLMSTTLNHNPRYNSPYDTPSSHFLGMSGPSSLSTRQLSGTNNLSTEEWRTHRGTPALPVTLNQTPTSQAHMEFPCRSLESSSRSANPLVSQPLARGSFQPVPSSSARVQGYDSPYGSQARSINGAGHGHDFSRAQQQERNAFEPVRASSYISPYYRDPKESRTREYSFAPYYSDLEQQIVPAHTEPQGIQAELAVRGYQHDHVQEQQRIFVPQPLIQRQHLLQQHQLLFLQSQQRHPAPQPLPSSTGSYAVSYTSSSPSPAPSTPGRRGRPPGKTAVKPSKLAVEIHFSPATKPRGRPSRNAVEASRSKSMTAPAGSESGVKKRGRPYKSAESLAKAKAKANGEYIPGKRGRQVKTVQLVYEEVAVPLAAYVPFICEWKGCTARLHNLETLKKHVIAMHGKKGGAEEKVCSWGKCGGAIHRTENRIAEYFSADSNDSNESDDSDDRDGDNNKIREDSVISVSSNVSVVIVVSKDSEEPQPVFESKVFASWKERMEHIDEAHFLPFSWHVGDGPKATSLDRRPEAKAIDPWLFHENGVQVTPSIEGQAIEDGIAKYKNKARWVNEMKKLNLNIKKDSSGPYMKTQAQMVQEEGVGMETPSVSVSRSVSGERENGTEEGSSVSTGDGNEIGRIGENNDTKMEEVEMEEELQASIEESGADDSEDELMVLDRL